MNNPSFISRIRVLEEIVAEMYSSYTLPKRTPYADRVNSIISRLAESGLLMKWLDNKINYGHISYEYILKVSRH